mmetsp:Transcript_6069/g.9301  ORF Transcript_6069/g.9301 Transcript_6069/m.9301 type:complete len:406 (-) Transcript_6069:245-1462(-)|eukprot:CAMPEP_0178926302 /NCGR_PEP_ID=MMETSP0786-20121207/18452_1 /TAXON_ID=186022 /ORGANISM="Thalassionema frauenfeldii, Strain CCMP 1798" /LENGTH=405 /DNA_ID=CAMNT_0020601399 /DNA_START=155 /DNA_END=1372 /DNA_ORIENTATION=-
MDDGVPADDSSDTFSRRGSDFTETVPVCEGDDPRRVHQTDGVDDIKTQSSHDSTSSQKKETASEEVKSSDTGDTVSDGAGETEPDDTSEEPSPNLTSSRAEESDERSEKSEDLGHAVSNKFDESEPEDLSSSSLHGEDFPPKKKRSMDMAKSPFIKRASSSFDDSFRRPSVHERDSISERLMIDGVIDDDHHPVYSNTSFRRGSMEGSVVSGNRFRTPSEEERLAGMLQNALDVDELLRDLNEMDHAYLESLRPQDSSVHSTDFSLSQPENDDNSRDSDLESQMLGTEHWEETKPVTIRPVRKKKIHVTTKMTKPSIMRAHTSFSRTQSSNELETIAEKEIEKKPAYTRKKVIILVVKVVVAGGALATIIVFLVKIIKSGAFSQGGTSTAVGESRNLVDYYVVRT